MANAVEKLNTIEIGDIEKVNTLTDDNIEDINTLEFAGASIAWAGTRAVTAGGSNSSDADLNRIQYKTVGASANAVDFGDLQTNRSMHQCAGSNITRGMWGGGIGRADGTSGSTVYGVTDTDYVTVASTSNGTDFGNMALGAGYGATGGSSNGTLLFSSGGYSGTTSAYVDAMEYFTIASTGNGTEAGDLSVGKSNASSTNGDTRFLVVGGFTA